MSLLLFKQQQSYVQSGTNLHIRSLYIYFYFNKTAFSSLCDSILKKEKPHFFIYYNLCNFTNNISQFFCAK